MSIVQKMDNSGLRSTRSKVRHAVCTNKASD